MSRPGAHTTDFKLSILKLDASDTSSDEQFNLDFFELYVNFRVES